MRVIVQRVSQASVTVNGEQTGVIGKGLMLLVGIHEEDSKEEVEWMAEKMFKLRIFEDEEGKMNRSVTDEGAGILLVSQFTLYGDVRKGTRPSFVKAAGPEKAEELYNYMVDYMKSKSQLNIQTGIFAEHMDVDLTNDGPVTLVVER